MIFNHLKNSKHQLLSVEVEYHFLDASNGNDRFLLDM